MLVQIAPPPQGGAPTVVVTVVPWRTGWRYRERGYRHIYWDAGTMLSQLLAAADSVGLEPWLYTRFPDASVSELIGAEGVNEWPVAVVALGEGEPALEPGGVAAVGDVDAAPIEFPLVTAAQRAGDRSALGPRRDRGAPVEVSDEGKPVEDVVLARSSQRRMDRTRDVPDAVVRICMSVAVRGIDVPHRVAVHNVAGVPPGLYRWPDVSTPVRGGNLRREVSHACGDPGLPRDAAFVVIAATDVGALEDREYRGTACGLGASASGMTFVDCLVSRFFGAFGKPFAAACHRRSPAVASDAGLDATRGSARARRGRTCSTIARRTTAPTERSSDRARSFSAAATSSGMTAEIFVTVPPIGASTGESS
jgi:hypothetical protein